MMDNTFSEAKRIHDYVIEIQRDLHRHPEPSLQEFRTTKRICEELDKLGIPYRTTEPTGVIAEVKGTKEDDPTVIMLRGDNDALSVNECTGLDYASEVPGMMHACGHDAHTAMLIGAARILNEHRDEFSGTVRFLFQPAEEVLEGAKLMIAQGAMDGVFAGFGIHMDPLGKVGRVSLRHGAAYAAPAQFTIKVEGEGGPGAMPHLCHDACLAACAININLQSINARFVRPDQPVVVTVGQVHSGTRFNVIAAHAVLDGTYRTFDRDIHRQVREMIEDISAKTAAIYGCTVEVEIPLSGDPMINDPEATDLVKQSTINAFGDDSLYHERELNMGSEDFAFYGQMAPCAFVFLGCGEGYPLHHEKFKFDDDSVDYGVALYVQMAIDALEKYSK